MPAADQTDTHIKQLETENQELRAQKQCFGPASEKMPVMQGQCSLFDGEDVIGKEEEYSELIYESLYEEGICQYNALSDTEFKNLI